MNRAKNNTPKSNKYKKFARAPGGLREAKLKAAFSQSGLLRSNTVKP